MIKAIIVIIILIFIAYGVLEILYRMYIRDRQSMEKDLLNLEQRVEKYNNDQLKLNRKIRENMLDLITEFEKIEKKVKKNEKRK